MYTHFPIALELRGLRRERLAIPSDLLNAQRRLLHAKTGPQYHKKPQTIGRGHRAQRSQCVEKKYKVQGGDILFQCVCVCVCVCVLSLMVNCFHLLVNWKYYIHLPPRPVSRTSSVNCCSHSHPFPSLSLMGKVSLPPCSLALAVCLQN